MFVLENGAELTDDKLAEFITAHHAEVSTRYKKLDDAYRTDYEILHYEKKPDWKPDNRLAVNFGKYIVDTMNGFFIGQPIKITVDEGENSEKIADYVEMLDQYNDQDDNNAELSKICSIFGKGYELYFVDDAGEIGITYLSPLDGFMVYDDSIIERPLYFVRLYTDESNVLHGSVSDKLSVRYFTQKGKIRWETEEKIHGFDDVPATEYRENEEQIGLFEPVMSLIDAYNKAISEKANDVDYFADAYLKVLGVQVDNESLQKIRDNRTINFEGDTERLIVEFMPKPDGDTTQEHLINRLEKLIFQISMVSNISDENFGTSSGIALKYKLQAMSNLAKTKERKFASGMNRRYKLIFSNKVNSMKADDWVKLHYHFTRNFPANVAEEVQIAGQLSGIVSQETQLKVLSVVDNPRSEMEKMEAEALSLREALAFANPEVASME